LRESDIYALLEGASEAAFVVDSSGTICFWSRNAEALFGQPAEQVLGKPCAAVVGGLDSTGRRVCTQDCAILEICRTSTQVAPYDVEIKTKSGRRWVNVSILVAQFTPGGRRMMIHLMRDIDARKKIEILTKEIAVRVGKLTHQQAEEIIEPARAPVPVVNLTPRELRILDDLSQGKGTGTIARDLQISPVTVRNHIHRVLGKLGVHTRLEAVIRAARERII
jgi:PAS domain S-box-containing protein